jgi:hypothetical protein
MMDYVNVPGFGVSGTTYQMWQSFFFALLPYVEQTALYNTGAITNRPGNWDNNALWELNPPAGQAVDIYQCPSDPTNNAGLCTGGPRNGGAGTSYAPNAQLFGIIQGTNGNIIQSTYKLYSIPDGASNQVGVVERYVNPYTGFNNCWTDHRFNPIPNQTSKTSWGDGVNLSATGTSAWCVYGYWGAGVIPQTTAGAAAVCPPMPLPITNAPVISGPAGPNYWSPESGHVSMQTLLMDGSVRGITNITSQATWTAACQPNDGAPLGSDW